MKTAKEKAAIQKEEEEKKRAAEAIELGDVSPEFVIENVQFSRAPSRLARAGMVPIEAKSDLSDHSDYTLDKIAGAGKKRQNRKYKK